MIIDDAWAEYELEKQLRSLTPIKCLEEAEHQLKLYYNDDDNSATENCSSFPPDDECLPDSAEAFLSLIQHASSVVEQELAECKTLIEKEIEGSTNTECEGTEGSEEECDIITDALQEECEEYPSLDESTTLTQNYKLEFQSDLPIYQIQEAEVPDASQPDTQKQAEVEEKERIEREAARKMRLEDEKRILEKLQQEELKKIEEEMRLAEEALRIEVLEHEERMKQLNEEHELEKKIYEEEVRRREEEVMIKKEQSATKIQAHFRGMRARRLHGKELGRRICERKRELLKEQLQYYEGLINQERAAVEAEIEARRQEQLEKERAEARAEEIRQRHLEKERLRKMEEERKRVEEEENERARKQEEEERAALMSSQQVLHWLKNNDADVPEQDDLKAVDNKPGTPKSNSLYQQKDEELAKETSNTENADCDDNIDKIINEVENEKNQVCKTPGANSLDNVPSNLNVSANHTNLNSEERVDNNTNRSAAAPENDNSKKSKTSFLGNIASRAKNIFKPLSSKELTKENQAEDVQVENESEKIVQNIAPVNETDLVKESSDSEQRPSVNDVETVKESQPVPQSDNSPKLVAVAPATITSNFTQPSAEPIFALPSAESISPETAIKPIVPPLIAPPVSSNEEPITSSRNRSNLSPHHETSPAIKHPSLPLTHKTNPVTLSIDTSLTPHPPHWRPTSSLDLSKPQAARDEYRRKRKLRDDLNLARELSVVVKPAPSSECIAPVDISWEEFVAEFEESYTQWLNLSWKESLPRPSTAGSARVRSNNYPQIELRVINGTTLIEQCDSVAVANPPAAEVYVKNCNNVDISLDRSCEEVRLLSLDHCTNCTLHVVDSRVKCVYQNSCELKKLGRFPESLVLLDVARNDITRLGPLSCSNLVLLTLSHNSLVSTRGLQSLPNLVTLDLSYNNLSHVINLDQCGVLQHLNLAHNQLVTVPNLQNNILLATLDLSANGLTDLTNLSSSWLPCLVKLKLVANGLDSIPQLHKISPFLRFLDVSNNMLSHTDEFTTALQYCQLKDVLFEGTDLDTDTINSYIVSMSSAPGPTSKLINFFLEIQKKLRQEMDISPNILGTEKVASLECRQQSAKQIRSDIVSYHDQVKQSKPTDTVTRSAVTKCQTLAHEKDVVREDPREDERKQTLKQQPGDCEIRTKNTDFNDVINEQDLNENSVMPCNVMTSRGGVMTSRGGVMTSRGGVMTSHDEVMTSRDGVMTSRGGVMTSRGGVMTSRGGVMTSRDSAILVLQSLIRGFKSRLRFKNICDQRREAMCNVYFEMCGAAGLIQRVWRGYVVRKLLWDWLPWLHRRLVQATIRDKAAVKIQSIYRGYLLRRRLSEVFQQAVYDISDISDCESLQQIGEFDEMDYERGWGLPPTPSLQHHVPLPTPSPQQEIPPRSFSDLTVLTEGPVPLLPISKLRSRDTSRAQSMRSEISVLSLPPSRRNTPNKRQAAMAAEWGVKNQDTVMRLVQRSKKFGKQISQKEKRELVRQKLLQGSRRVSVVESPPPPTAESAAGYGDDVVYQWDTVPSLCHQNTSAQHSRGPALHTRIYRNPQFNETSNTRLPPLTKKPDRPNYTAFR